MLLEPQGSVMPFQAKVYPSLLLTQQERDFIEKFIPDPIIVLEKDEVRIFSKTAWQSVTIPVTRGT